MERYLRLDQFLEPGLFQFDAIDTGRKVRQMVLARNTAGGLVADICVPANGGDSGVDDGSFGGVADASAQRRVCGLRTKCRPRRHEEEESEDEDPAHVVINRV